MIAFVFGVIALTMPIPLGVAFCIIGAGLVGYEVYAITQKAAQDRAELGAIHRRLDSLDALDAITRDRKLDTLRRLQNMQRDLTEAVVTCDMVTRVDNLALDGNISITEQQRGEAQRRVRIAQNKAWLEYQHREIDLRHLLDNLSAEGLQDDELTQLVKGGVNTVPQVDAVVRGIRRLIEAGTKRGENTDGE